MNTTYRLGRFCSLILPFTLLAIFFKYLHQLNLMLASIEGIGFRKTLLILFIAFFAIWSFVYLGVLLFLRVISWAWTGKILTPRQKVKTIVKKDSEQPLKNNIEEYDTKEREELFKLDLQDESAA